MNIYNISLSSDSMSTSSIEDELLFFDSTVFSVSLSGITEEQFPIFLKIDWGDGNTEKFDNIVFKNYRESSIIPEVLSGKFSSIIQNKYKHEYFPSTTSLYKNLSAQFYIEYGNRLYNWFVIPIRIRSGGYFETVGDLQLINTNILPLTSNSKQHQFITEEGGFLVEVEND